MRATLAVLVTAGVTACGAGATPTSLISKDEHFLDVDYPGVRGFENGDCFRDPKTNEALGNDVLNAVECVGAENEVYTFVTLSDGPWDTAAVAREARDGCRRDFEELWGGESEFAFYAVLPTQRSWEQDRDRSAMCVVYSPRGKLQLDPIEARP